MFAEKHGGRVFFPFAAGRKRAVLATEIVGLSILEESDRERTESMVKRTVPNELPADTKLIAHKIDV